VLDQVFDDHVDELDLIGAERLVVQEVQHGFYRGCPIQADQGTDEQAETLGLVD